MQLAILNQRGGEEVKMPKILIGLTGRLAEEEVHAETAWAQEHFQNPGKWGFAWLPPSLPILQILLFRFLFMCRACSPLHIADEEEGLSIDNRPLFKD